MNMKLASLHLRVFSVVLIENPLAELSECFGGANHLVGVGLHEESYKRRTTGVSIPQPLKSIIDLPNVSREIFSAPGAAPTRTAWGVARRRPAVASSSASPVWNARQSAGIFTCARSPPRVRMYSPDSGDGEGTTAGSDTEADLSRNMAEQSPVMSPWSLWKPHHESMGSSAVGRGASGEGGK